MQRSDDMLKDAREIEQEWKTLTAVTTIRAQNCTHAIISKAFVYLFNLHLVGIFCNSILNIATCKRFKFYFKKKKKNK